MIGLTKEEVLKISQELQGVAISEAVGEIIEKNNKKIEKDLEDKTLQILEDYLRRNMR